MIGGVLAHVALGGNLGDVPTAFRLALRRLGAMPGIRVEAVSRLYRTEPLLAAGEHGADVDDAPAPDYWNAVARLRTRIRPEALLARCLRLEVMAGRARCRMRPWQPRTLDLDLLTYGHRMINKPHLHVPHPRLHERTFVLQPLAELDPMLVVAGWNLSVRELLRAHEDPFAGIYQIVADWLGGATAGSPPDRSVLSRWRISRRCAGA